MVFLVMGNYYLYRVFVFNVLCSSPENSLNSKIILAGVGLEEDHENDERARTPLL